MSTDKALVIFTEACRKWHRSDDPTEKVHWRASAERMLAHLCRCCIVDDWDLPNPDYTPEGR